MIAEDRFKRLRTVCGVDAGYHQERNCLRAGVAVYSFPRLELLTERTAERPVDSPYAPGLLSFREAPVLLAALAGLDEAPDLLLCDGQGLAHPRRFGLACHLGVLLDTPSIGVAKSRYIGDHAEVPPDRGAWKPLRDGPEIIGAVVRTRTGVRPVYVSVGHRVSLPTAVRLTLDSCPRFRLPEPLRRAHRLGRVPSLRHE